ncbi:MAG: transposase [Patescibacteria group bacterium]|jgi:putative transposase
MKRKDKFIEGEIYHIFNKSISNYGIFKDFNNSQRFLNVVEYYNNRSITECFSQFTKRKKFDYKNIIYPGDNSLCKILTYCIMPDHYHFLLKIIEDYSLSQFINNVENSFTRYFNIKFGRKGPLWQSVFKSVEIRSNEQLLHVSRYIHLNPTTSRLVDKPEDWIFSSYKDFITDKNLLNDFMKEISIDDVSDYKQFIENNIEYQRELKHIKKIILE